MKITKRQLRRIIKEVIDDQPIRMISGDSFTTSQDPKRPWGSSAGKNEETFSDVIVMSPNADSVLIDGEEVYIENVPRQLEAVSGFPMEGNDPDNLIFALEEMQQDGYIELMVTYENGRWGW